jgi:hypothetical protein
LAEPAIGSSRPAFSVVVSLPRSKAPLANPPEDGATYEVEVTKADGSQVDVRLDGSFDVVVVEGDEEEEGDSD